MKTLDFPRLRYTSVPEDCVLVNSEDPDKMLHTATFHMGLSVCQSIFSEVSRIRSGEIKL